jgi:uncharacterized protein (DUF1499 family)
MSRLWQVPALLVALLLLGAPLLAFLGLAGPGAFSFFLAGLGLGLISTIGLAAAAAFASATGKAWRGAAVRATVVPLVLTLGVLGISYGSTGHTIHDVTTDLEDTLQFTPDVAALEDLPMERADVLLIQQEIYPDIQPLIVDLSPASAFAAAEQAAAAMPGWEIVSADAASGRIEATATSRVFHFVDDVVIRVQSAGPDASRIDVRSRSRMGRSDLGANSERIRLYLLAVQASP